MSRPTVFPIEFPGDVSKYTPKFVDDWIRADKKYYEHVLGDALYKKAPKVVEVVKNGIAWGTILKPTLDIFLKPEPVGYQHMRHIQMRDAYLRGLNQRNPIPPSSNPTHRIYVEPSKVYIESTRTIYVPIPPARRIAPLGQKPDTKKAVDLPDPVITVQESFANRTWGALLHEPVYNGEIKLKRFEYDKYEGNIKKELKRSQKEFNHWLLNKRPIALDDQSLLFIDGIDFNSGTKTFDTFCGLRSIAMLYDAFFAQSKNAIRPITFLIPKEIVSKKTKIPVGKYDAAEALYSNTRGGSANRVSGESIYPIVLPADITDKDKKNVLITSHADFLVHLYKTIDAICGQFPLEIEIEDTQPGRMGNQKAKIEIPNIAEALTELVGAATIGQGYNQTLAELIARNLSVSTEGLISSVVTQDLARACAEYFGFQSKEELREIQLPYSPNEQKLDKFLLSSKQKYKTIELTDEKDLNDYLVDLLQAASIIRAIFLRKVDPNKGADGVKERLREMYRKYSEGQNDSMNSWNDFLEQVEKGFTDENLTDKLNPYGRNYSERPKIRDTDGQ